MTSRPLLLLALLAPSALQAASTWVWKDANGTHYSDRPVPGATQQELPSVPQRGDVVPQQTAPLSAPTPSGRFRYTSCTISSPGADEVFNNTDSVSVAVSLEPGQRPNDTIRVSLDGAPLSNWPPSATSFTLSALPRGSHVLSVTVVEEGGRTLCVSPLSQFHLRQPTVLSIPPPPSTQPLPPGTTPPARPARAPTVPTAPRAPSAPRAG